MKCYNVDVPLLRDDEYTAYVAIRRGLPVSSSLTAEGLAAIAEYWACKNVAAQITELGAVARVVGRDYLGYWECAVCFSDQPHRTNRFDAEAACRIFQRLGAGLDLTEAIARTDRQCEHQPLPTDAEIDAEEIRMDAENAVWMAKFECSTK